MCKRIAWIYIRLVFRYVYGCPVGPQPIRIKHMKESGYIVLQIPVVYNKQ